MPSAYQPPTSAYKPVYAAGYLPTFMQQGMDNANQQAQTQQLQAGGGSGAGGNYGHALELNSALDYTRGRGDATMQDPYLQSALTRLSDIQSGKELPYSKAVKAQMLSRQGDMSAAAEHAQAQSLAEQQASLGGNASDPSYKAAMRAMDQGRQAGNQAAAGDIDTQATLQNFAAQNEATRQLQASRLAQHSQADTQYTQAAAFLAGSGSQGEHVNAYPQQQPYQAPAFNPPPMPNYDFGDYSQPPAPAAPITTGTQANPVYAARDPYGGQGAPAAPATPTYQAPQVQNPWSWNPAQSQQSYIFPTQS